MCPPASSARLSDTSFVAAHTRRQMLSGAVLGTISGIALTLYGLAMPLQAQTRPASPALAAPQAAELRVLVHSSFALPKPLIAQFEAQTGAKLVLLKGGSVGEVLNKMVLTKNKPIADVVVGLDQAMLAKAIRHGVLAPLPTALQNRPATVMVSAKAKTYAMPIDQGFVTLNYDKAWFDKQGLPLPKSLADLTTAPYRNLLVVQNPATSSVGQAFAVAVIAHLGQTQALQWWRDMRQNGVKIAKGWSEAYYTDFSKNGGSRPLVVSYASSPAAEVFYSKEPLSTPPTGSLDMDGAVFRQVEFAARIQGGQQVALSHAWMQFLRSKEVQTALQTQMWMLPVEPGVAAVDAMRHAAQPLRFDAAQQERVAQDWEQWLPAWLNAMRR